MIQEKAEQSTIKNMGKTEFSPEYASSKEVGNVSCATSDCADTAGTECCRYKHRPRVEERDLLNRLNRIEGQIRGIKNMVEEERYCVDILTQVSAVQAALNSFNRILLSNHIHTCVVEKIEAGDLEVVDELCKTIQKIMK